LKGFRTEPEDLTNRRYKPNTKASNETTRNHNIKTCRCGLQDATDDEDSTAHDDRHAPADEVGDITSNNRPEKITS
jgi:hypothetical protein